MFDSKRELLDRIRRGESTYLGLKEVRFAGDGVSGPETDTLADELAAIANSRGGVFVFGVEDRTRDVVGIPAERLDAGFPTPTSKRSPTGMTRSVPARAKPPISSTPRTCRDRWTGRSWRPAASLPGT